MNELRSKQIVQEHVRSKFAQLGLYQSHSYEFLVVYTVAAVEAVESVPTVNVWLTFLEITFLEIEEW